MKVEVEVIPIYISKADIRASWSEFKVKVRLEGVDDDFIQVMAATLRTIGPTKDVQTSGKEITFTITVFNIDNMEDLIAKVIYPTLQEAYRKAKNFLNRKLRFELDLG